MSDSHEGWSGARRSFRLEGAARRVRDDVDAELRFHLEGRVEELMARGMSREAAEAEARARFGDVARVEAELEVIDGSTHRRRERGELLDGLRREMRHAVRALLRSPAFSAIAVLTLALGIGATTGIFTVVDRIVLRPLPYADAGRLVYLSSPVPGWKPDAEWGLSQAGYFFFTKNARSFSGLGAFNREKMTLVSDDRAERVQGALATASLMRVLRLRPAVGRLITDDDDRPNAAPVAVLGYDFWQSHFGGDPRVVGKKIDLEAHAIPVVGIMEPGRNLPDYAVDVWIPRQLDPAQPPVNSHMEFETVARLAPGVSLPAAKAEAARLTLRFPELFPQAYSPDFMQSTRFTTKVASLRDHVVGSTARVLWILLASVGLVLLIACANVTNLFLARIESRRREVAIRTALGAGQARLAWHFLTESLVVAAAAAVLGIALAAQAIRVLLATVPAGLPRIGEVRVGWASVAFAIGIALLAGVVFGLVPLLRSHRSTIDVATLRDGSRGVSLSKRQHAVRGALVVAQVAFALMLLAGAGLMLQSYQRLRGVKPGFDPAGVLAVDIDLPYARYGSYEKVATFQRELATRLAALGGVMSVGATQQLPLEGGDGCSSVFTQDRATIPGAPTPCVPTPQVAPGYFRALGIPVDGREPEWSDVERRDGEVVVSRALADKLWPGERAIGKGIKGNGYGGAYYHVVGVAGDVRALGLDKPVTEAVYFPMLPLARAPLWSPPRGMTIVVRTRASRPAALAGAVRRVVSELDPDVPIANARTMDDVVAHSMARVSFTMLLLGIAAGMSLLLSVVGLYGVISYLVSQRRGEIGIRIALGAPGSLVGRMVVLQSVRLAALGVVLGLVGAIVSMRVLRSLLFEVSPTDPLTLGAVGALLIATATAAAYIPARRAATVDPMVALRTD